MLRHRRSVAPGFRVPPPYVPFGGVHQPLQHEGIHCRLAVFQVCEDDTHDNYVVCQGWDLDSDPHCRHIFTSQGGKTPINVAKSWANRGTKPYKKGDCIAAAKFRTTFGDNPGVAKDSTGQPEDLDEKVEALKDDDGKPIQWMELGGGGTNLIAVELKDDLDPGQSATGWTLSWSDDDHEYYYPDYEDDTNVTVYDAQYRFRSYGYDSMPEGERGALVFVDDDSVVISGQQMARICSAQAKIATGHTLAKVDHVTPMDSGQSPVDDESDELDVVADTITEDDEMGMIAWDEVNGFWRTFGFPSVPVQIRWNEGGNHKLEYSTNGGDDWITIDTARVCP